MVCIIKYATGSDGETNIIAGDKDDGKVGMGKKVGLVSLHNGVIYLTNKAHCCEGKHCFVICTMESIDQSRLRTNGTANQICDTGSLLSKCGAVDCGNSNSDISN